VAVATVDCAGMARSSADYLAASSVVLVVASLATAAAAATQATTSCISSSALSTRSSLTACALFRQDVASVCFEQGTYQPHIRRTEEVKGGSSHRENLPLLREE
jgi:hypothetical protein